jgi:hypothetical protein
MFANLSAIFRRWRARSVPLVQPEAPKILSTDRRQFIRFPSSGQTEVRTAGLIHRKKFSAWITNVSCGGIRLVGEIPFRRGSLLHVELQNEPTARTEAILACVVHVAHVHETQWTVGCSFIRELTGEELQGFVRE